MDASAAEALARGGGGADPRRTSPRPKRLFRTRGQGPAHRGPGPGALCRRSGGRGGRRRARHRRGSPRPHPGGIRALGAGGGSRWQPWPPDAPILHETRVQSESRLDKRPTTITRTWANVLTSYSVGRGDPDEGFAASDLVFEDVYTTPKIQHGPPGAPCGHRFLGSGGQADGLFSHAKPLVDTGPTRRAFRAAAIHGAGGGALRGRRVRRQGAPAPGTPGRGPRPQGPPAGAVEAHARGSLLDRPLSRVGGAHQDRRETRRYDPGPGSGKRSTTPAPTHSPVPPPRATAARCRAAPTASGTSA